jgi:hypothetical protein
MNEFRRTLLLVVVLSFCLTLLAATALGHAQASSARDSSAYAVERYSPNVLCQVRSLLPPVVTRAMEPTCRAVEARLDVNGVRSRVAGWVRQLAEVIRQKQ